jgi:hypothetical protein
MTEQEQMDWDAAVAALLVLLARVESRGKQ